MVNVSASVGGVVIIEIFIAECCWHHSKTVAYLTLVLKRIVALGQADERSIVINVTVTKSGGHAVFNQGIAVLCAHVSGNAAIILKHV